MIKIENGDIFTFSWRLRCIDKNIDPVLFNALIINIYVIQNMSNKRATLNKFVIFIIFFLIHSILWVNFYYYFLKQNK